MSIPKKSNELDTISMDRVLNNLNIVLLNENSKDCTTVLFVGKASTPYNSTGIHLDLIRNNTTSSDATPPTLPTRDH